MSIKRKVGAVACGMMGLVMITSTGIGSEPNRAHMEMITVDGHSVPAIGPLPTVVPQPPGNVNYAAKVALGKQLYFDGRLSKNDAISCAFCHNPLTGFADPKQTSAGVGGLRGGRQSPTVYNTAFNPLQFWDGRAGSLEEQAIGPIHNPK
jgi:cytochrome c peroxidase